MTADIPDKSLLWLVVLGFIVAFILAFGHGANDVANSFGTTVGAKVLGLFEACILASIFEFIGAILIGARVSDTLREGIIDTQSFNGTEKLAMVGAFSALSGTSCWVIAATFLSLPVSVTHGIVGSTMGYAIVEYGVNGVHWSKLWMIAASWVISPLLSGVVSSLIFLLIKTTVLKKEDSFEAGLKSIGIFYGLTVAVNFFSIFYRGSHLLGFDKIPLYAVLIMTFGVAVLVALIVHFTVRPWLRKKIIRQVAERERPIVAGRSVENCWQVLREKFKLRRRHTREEVELCQVSTTGSAAVPDGDVGHSRCASDSVVASRGDGHQQANETLLEETEERTSEEIPDACASTHEQHELLLDEPKTGQLFAFLQILMASFGAFAHGGNDVSNAIGPLTTLWVIYQSKVITTESDTPFWMFVYGGLGIAVGICVWGRKVIKTMGEDLTLITPSSGFTIELGSALTVLAASNLGIPISTTHCKVGSVVSIGWLRSREYVNWKLFGNIVLAWIVTVPCSGGMAAAVYATIRQVVY